MMGVLVFEAMAELFYRVLVLLLASFRPAALFHRINQLPWYRDTLRDWADSLGYRHDDAVLEVGCATGSLSHYLAKQGLRVSAVDRSTAMIRRAIAEDNSQVRFRQADIMALPYVSGGFDWVISASVINVVSEPQAAITELARVCRDGGWVSVLLPSAHWDGSGLSGLKEGLGLKGFSAVALTMWDRLATKMDSGEIQQMFLQAGLAEIRVRDYLQGLVVGVSGRKARSSWVS